MRVDTTVVETNIHYPTDSSPFCDGVRVLTRPMKKITKIACAVGARLRDHSRSVKWRLLEIARNGEIYNYADIRTEVETTCGMRAWRGHVIPRFSSRR